DLSAVLAAGAQPEALAHIAGQRVLLASVQVTALQDDRAVVDPDGEGVLDAAAQQTEKGGDAQHSEANLHRGVDHQAHAKDQAKGDKQEAAAVLQVETALPVAKEVAFGRFDEDVGWVHVPPSRLFEPRARYCRGGAVESHEFVVK